MLWPSDKLNEVYDNICKNALGRGCTVLIYVGLDCDALCACRILTGLLKSDQVAFRIKPVQHRKELLDDIPLSCEAEDVRSVVMLNCGGDMDLETVFGSTFLESGAIVYVVDSRRPLHHINVLPSAQPIILSDEFMDEEIEHLAKLLEDVDDEQVRAALAVQDESDDESEEENDIDGDETKDGKSEFKGDEDEFSSGSDSEEGNGRKRKAGSYETRSDSVNIQDGSSSSSADGRGNEENNANDINFTQREQDAIAKELEGTSPHKRRRTQSQASDDSKLSSTEIQPAVGNSKRERIERIQSYYGGSLWGTPAAHVLFAMAQQLNKETKPYLWLAIVACTWHYLGHRMDDDAYIALVEAYNDRIKHMTARRGARGFRAGEENIAVRAVDQDEIKFGEEIHLMLHRHWSLHLSFYYSDYPAAHMQTYRTHGENKLHTLFAKMGISKREAQQKFAFMDVQLKHALLDKVADNVGPDMALKGDFFFSSFKYRAGYNSELSAADVAYSATALLDGFALAPSTLTMFQKLHASKQASDLDLVNAAGTDGANDGPAAPHDDNDLDNNNNDLDVDEEEEECKDGAQDGKAAKKSRRNELVRSLWQESFNSAYDMLGISSAIGDKGKGVFDDGVETCKQIQQMIAEEAGNLLMSKAILTSPDFRYAGLENLPAHRLCIFSQPDVLTRFLHFLMQAHTAKGKWLNAHSKPLVVYAKNPLTGFACFAAAPICKLGEVKPNSFGRHFREAAKLLRIPTETSNSYDAFIKVPLNDSQRFILALHGAIAGFA